MGRRVLPAALTVALLALPAGCGGGSSTVVKTVTTAPAPAQSLVIAHRAAEGPRLAPGEGTQGAGDCTEAGGGGVKTIRLRSTGESCVRAAPRDRLLFVNETGIGAHHREPNPVELGLGDYKAWAGIGKSALFPTAGSFLGPGLHPVDTGAGAATVDVLVLPEGCALHDPEPGEGLCFAAGAPPCPGPKLLVRAGRAGAAAGTIYQRFEVVNRSRATCTVSGFPHIVALDAHGHPIGPPARLDHLLTTMSGNHPRRIALAPGGIAVFEMNYGEAANYSPPCGARKTAALRITIPPSGPPQRVPYEMERCPEQGLNVGRIE